MQGNSSVIASTRHLGGFSLSNASFGRKGSRRLIGMPSEVSFPWCVSSFRSFPSCCRAWYSLGFQCSKPAPRCIQSTAISELYIYNISILNSASTILISRTFAERDERSQMIWAECCVFMIQSTRRNQPTIVIFDVVFSLNNFAYVQMTFGNPAGFCAKTRKWQGVEFLYRNSSLLNLRSSPADFFPAEDGRQVDQPFVFVAASFTPLQSPFFFLIRSGHPYHRNSTRTDFWDDVRHRQDLSWVMKYYELLLQEWRNLHFGWSIESHWNPFQINGSMVPGGFLFLGQSSSRGEMGSISDSTLWPELLRAQHCPAFRILRQMR